jgi:exonuclease III
LATERVERRLAAILAADVAGYSRLIGMDEDGTLQAFKTIRIEQFEPTIAAHRGRLVKTTGDGFLVEFSSVVNALRCAVEVQARCLSDASICRTAIPAPSPKFDYKLRWLERLTGYAKALLESGAPAVLAGDFNVMPTDLDVYAPERWVDDAQFRPEVRDAYRRLVAQGWTDALRALHPDERTYTFWKYFRNAFARDAGLRIDHLLLGPSLAGRLVAAGVERDVRARDHASDHAPVWI